MSFDKKQSHSPEESASSPPTTDAFEIDNPTSTSLPLTPTKPNASLTPNSLLNLQRTIGNRAVMRLISGKFPALPKPGRLRSPAVQRSGSAVGVIQRVNLNNVELIKKKLGLPTITHNDLASIKYPDLSIEELKELATEVTRLLVIYTAKDSEEQIALFKANKSIQFFLSKRSKEEQTEKISSNKAMFLVGNDEFHIKDLAFNLKVDISVLESLPKNVYTKLDDLLLAIEGKTGRKPVGFPPFLKDAELKDYQTTFKQEWDKEFFDELEKFRQNKNIFPNPKFKGGEGQIFLSDVNFGLCLKRWFEKRLDQFNESVGLLEQACQKVEQDEFFSKLVSVVKVRAKGKDWIVRDFDLASSMLKVAIEKDETAKNAWEQIESKALHIEDPFLKDLAVKIARKSENIHWSPSLKKILVIDMM